jgi:hypothetical protein
VAKPNVYKGLTHVCQRFVKHTCVKGVSKLQAHECPVRGPSVGGEGVSKLLLDAHADVAAKDTAGRARWHTLTTHEGKSVFGRRWRHWLGIGAIGLADSMEHAVAACRKESV